MFAFSQIEPRTAGQIAPQIPLNRFLGAAWDQGVHDSMAGSLYRISEQLQLENDTSFWGVLDQQAGPMLTQAAANEQYGTRTLRFDAPVYEGVAQLLRSRHDEQERRNYLLSAGATGVGRSVASFGVGMLASLSNPVDFSLMFVPIVGSEAMASRLATMGIGPARQALARGLITEERLRNSVAAPKFVAAVVEGAVGQAIAEIPLYISNRMDQTPYTVMDSITNIALGGAFAGGLRLALSGAGRIVAKLLPETRAALAQKGVADFLLGEDINLHKLAELDEKLIREKVVFDVTAARVEAKKAVEGVGLLKDWRAGELRMWAEAQLEVAGNLGGVDQPNLFKIAADWIPIWENQGKGVERIKKLFETAQANPSIINLRNLAAEFNLDFDPAERKLPSQYYLAESPAARKLREAAGVALEDLKIPGQVSNATRKKQIAEVRAQREEQIQRLVQEEKARRTQAYVEELRSKFDPEKEATRKINEAITEQQNQGKVLTDEQVTKYAQKSIITDKDVAVLEKDVENLKKSLDIKDDDADLREFADELEKKMEKGGTSGAVEHIVKALEKLKISAGGDDVRYSGVPIETWNALIDLVIEGVKAGERLYVAVKRSLDSLLPSKDAEEARIALYDRVAELRPAAMLTADELRKDLGPMVKAAGRDTRRVYTGMWHGELIPDKGATQEDFNLLADSLGFITKTQRLVSRDEAALLSGQWESEYMRLLREAVEYREQHGAKKIVQEVADGTRAMATLDLLEKYDQSQDGFEFWHAAEINDALDNNQPVSKAAVKQYGLPVPGHYVEAGDLLVPAGKELSQVMEDQVLLDNLRNCIIK